MVVWGILIYYKVNKDKIFLKYIKLILIWKIEYWGVIIYKCLLSVLCC